MQPPRPCLNRAARSLTTGRTQTLGLIVPDLRNPFFAEIAKGTQGRARNTGHAVFIADTDIDLTLEAHALTAMRGEVEGVVLCSPRSSDELLISQLDGLPAVLLHRHIPGLPAVVADFDAGTRQAIEHLRALGHERIAHVAGPADSWNARRRRAAFEATVGDLVLGPLTDQFEGGVAAADTLLASGASAVVAYNDIVALGIVSRIHARGLRVPEDMSVVGFDGIDLSAMAPALTTINVPRREAAHRAVALLLYLIDGTSSAKDELVVLPTQLIVRGSTAPPAPH